MSISARTKIARGKPAETDRTKNLGDAGGSDGSHFDGGDSRCDGGRWRHNGAESSYPHLARFAGVKSCYNSSKSSHGFYAIYSQIKSLQNRRQSRSGNLRVFGRPCPADGHEPIMGAEHDRVRVRQVYGAQEPQASCVERGDYPPVIPSPSCPNNTASAVRPRRRRVLLGSRCRRATRRTPRTSFSTFVFPIARGGASDSCRS